MPSDGISDEELQITARGDSGFAAMARELLAAREELALLHKDFDDGEAYTADIRRENFPPETNGQPLGSLIRAMREELEAARAAAKAGATMASHHPKNCICVIHDYLARYPKEGRDGK